MKKLVMAAAALAVSTGTATAQDAAYDWSGAYIGAQVGYIWGDSLTRNFDGGTFDLFATPEADGTLGGIYLGYNHQFSNDVVVGVDADVAWSRADGDFDGARHPTGLPFRPNQHAVDIDYTAALRARLGYAIDRFMPYIAGGVAIGRANFAYDHAFADAVFSDTLTGWTIGGGVEFAATNNLILRAEYRYSDFGDGSAQEFPPYPWETQRYDLKTHDIRFGIAYKF